MRIMENIIKDIEDLRTNHAGEQHGYFCIGGTPDKDDFVIDTLDICKALAPYEIDYEFEDEIAEPNPDKYMGFWDDSDFADRYIDYLIDLGYIDEDDESNNSYNWSSPVSNHINFSIYKSLIDDSIYVLFKVHRFGDVRCNYTDSCILHFEHDYEWYEAFDEVNYYEDIEIDENEYRIEINFWHNGFEVYETDNWDYLFDVYGYDKDEVIADLKEKLKEKCVG